MIIIMSIMNITSLSVTSSLLYRSFCREQRKTYEEEDYPVFLIVTNCICRCSKNARQLLGKRLMSLTNIELKCTFHIAICES